jgi:hypothetical protein
VKEELARAAIEAAVLDGSAGCRECEFIVGFRAGVTILPFVARWKGVFAGCFTKLSEWELGSLERKFTIVTLKRKRGATQKTRG